LTIKVAKKEEYAKRPNLVACFHFIFMLASVFNILVVPTYFLIIHPVFMETLELSTNEISQLYLAHILPSFGVFTNLIITDIVFLKRHRKAVF
jgi:hypothetical protein